MKLIFTWSVSDTKHKRWNQNIQSRQDTDTMEASESVNNSQRSVLSFLSQSLTFLSPICHLNYKKNIFHIEIPSFVTKMKCIPEPSILYD